MTYTIPAEAININNESFFNTGCITEIEKIISQCSKFRLHVAEIMQTRFIYSLIIMSALIFFQLYIKYQKPQFSQTEFWQKNIDYRIDMIAIILMFFNILYIFLM